MHQHQAQQALRCLLLTHVHGAQVLILLMLVPGLPACEADELAIPAETSTYVSLALEWSNVVSRRYATKKSFHGSCLRPVCTSDKHTPADLMSMTALS